MMRTITVLDILERTAARLPDKIYLQDISETVTYRRCMEEAMRLGYALNRELAGARRVPVILFMDKGCRCVISMLGVLYSGNFYLPMEIKTPLGRLESIMHTMGNAVIITSEKDRESLLRTGYDGDYLLYEELLEKWSVEDQETCSQKVRDIKAGILDTELMYVLFTSGSTGVPKGVAAMHRSVVDYLETSVSVMGVEESDILGSQAPFYSDVSLKDIYMTMQAGATVCMIPQKLFMTPKKLLQYLDDHCVTTLMWVPTVFRMVSQFDALAKVRPSALKKVVFSGEFMPVPVYRYWKDYYPDVEFKQQYGPTEITGVCTSYKITSDFSDDETIPIGRPLPNTGIFLLDENDRIVPVGDTSSGGEICVYGTCLAAGYYNDSEKTRQSFVANPLVTAYTSLMYKTGDLARYNDDGDLVFISRRDYQVKHGGRRIELGEIETAFQSLDGMKAVCCVQDRKEDKLVLYYSGEIPETEMSIAVREKLPKYMIPAVYHRMELLPMLSNGKLDRKQMDRWANGIGCRGELLG